jgi:hypothetical protein
MKRVIAVIAATLVTACGGGGLPSGSVVNSPGSGPTQSPTKLVNVKVTVTIPPRSKQHGIRPNYISENTQSLVIGLSSVNGQGVSGVNPTTINTSPHSHGCKAGSEGTVCTATTSGSPGDDVFAVTTYAGANAAGAVLSSGTVEAKISGSGSGLQISNQLSLTLLGIIASLQLSLSPNGAKRGDPMKANVTLSAFDATGAQIVGPSNFAAPIALTIQGDPGRAFALHDAARSGASLLIVKPTSGITLNYDGNAQATSISVQASVNGPSSINKTANFTIHGKQPPPPVGTIYALNVGTTYGQSATVTEYSGTAKGNAKPERTLQLDSKLYARDIAVDPKGNLYVGYFDSPTGFSISNGTPDQGNEIAIYAPGASGSSQPSGYITADPKTKTAVFPLYMAFDSAGDLVTYGATSVDGNNGNDAVLIYTPGSTGAVAPANAWAFYTPTLRYAGPTGLALDSSGNFYVNGALHSTLGPVYGLYVTPASDYNNPAVTPSRTITWNPTTGLRPGYTTNVALNQSGEIFIANSLYTASGYPPCQGAANVYASGAGGSGSGGQPLKILTLETVLTSNSACVSPSNFLEAFFPTITFYGTTLFVVDDFNNAIDAFPSTGTGKVNPSLRIVGSSTGLNAPIAVVVTAQTSGLAKAGAANPQ